MSLESAKAFIERMKTDQDFAKKVSGCKDSEERFAFVRKAGYEFSEEELKASKAEFSDDELMQIAGGNFGFACNFKTRF